MSDFSLENENETDVALKATLDCESQVEAVLAGLAPPPPFRSSALKSLEVSPLDFLINAFSKRDTPAMRLGRGFHSRLLTPEEFKSQYWCYPPGVSGVSKAGREFASERDKSYRLSFEEMRLIEKMRKSVMDITDPDLSQYLLHPKTFKEHPMQWIEPDSGITCHGRTDMFFVFGDGISIFDFKTTDKASPLELEQVIFDNWYHVQAAMYIEGVASNFSCHTECVDYFIVSVLKTYPYSVRVFELSQDAVATGMTVYKRLASLYKKCLDTKYWPGITEYNHYSFYPEQWGNPDEINKVIII
jgi:hypothetical protein